jgi:hypothetical protein
MPTRRRVAAVAATLLAPVLTVGLTGPAAVAETAVGTGPLAAATAVAWQRTAVRTIYTERATPIPAGTLYLAFTSLAVHDAAVRAQRHGSHTATAAVAVAAHDVLLEYFPLSAANLDADLAASLAMVPDGATERRGARIGARAADRMIASRVGDGRDDPSRVYSKPAAPGIWQPAPGGVMAVAWLGFVDPVVDVRPTVLDGPDPRSSDAYAQDYEEVRTTGRLVAPDRTAEQEAIALFFAPNAVLMYRSALCDLLAAEPLGLLPTTRLFARIDAATATTLVETWRLKYEVGFWRPFQAIAGAADDGNGTTVPEAGWAPLVPNPPYADYTSGHAGVTAPFAEVLRRTLGDDTPLVLGPPGAQRSYATLTALEHDAFHARIWGGLHFRDAMDDGYLLGHTTAAKVMRAVR